MGRLKRLDATDLLALPMENDDHLVVTKQEVANIIRKFIENEVGNLPEAITTSHKDELMKHISQKMIIIEKELCAFIDYKFNTLAEKACESLITRKFNEEVDKKVSELLDKKIQEAIKEKSKKGKF